MDDGAAGIFLCPGWDADLPRAGGTGGAGREVHRRFQEFLEAIGVDLNPEEVYFGAMTCEGGEPNTAIPQKAIDEGRTIYVGVYQQAEDHWELFAVNPSYLKTDRGRKNVSASALRKSFSAPAAGTASLVNAAATAALRRKASMAGGGGGHV